MDVTNVYVGAKILIVVNVNSLTTRNQDDDTGFHMMPSPLRDIEVDLVHEVVVEPMHMIYLGKIL